MFLALRSAWIWAGIAGCRAPSELPLPSDPGHGSGAALAWNQPRSASAVRRRSGVLVLGERHDFVDFDVDAVADVEDR
jgi:hypothetical protein